MFVIHAHWNIVLWNTNIMFNCGRFDYIVVFNYSIVYFVFLKFVNSKNVHDSSSIITNL